MIVLVFSSHLLTYFTLNLHTFTELSSSNCDKSASTMHLKSLLVRDYCLSTVHKASYTRAHQMVREPNARICGWDCDPVLRHLQTVCIPFAAKRNLSVFCANTKRTGCAGCPFHAPGVLCPPQVCGKLTNHAPRTNSALVYTRFKVTIMVLCLNLKICK